MKFITGWDDAFVVEDAEHAVGDLDEALIRPGRCFGRLNVRALTADEAAKVAVKAAAGDPVKLEKVAKAFAEPSQRSYSLAKVFEMVK